MVPQIPFGTHSCVHPPVPLSGTKKCPDLWEADQRELSPQALSVLLGPELTSKQATRKWSGSAGLLPSRGKGDLKSFHSVTCLIVCGLWEIALEIKQMDTSKLAHSCTVLRCWPSSDARGQDVCIFPASPLFSLLLLQSPTADPPAAANWNDELIGSLHKVMLISHFQCCSSQE